MISRAKSKMIRSLDRKKIRDREGLFLVEGEKMVRELLDAEAEGTPGIAELIATSQWFSEHRQVLQNQSIQQTEAGEEEIRKLSHLVTPQAVMALARIPEPGNVSSIPAGDPVLGFESIRDPGNLGTIIRTADWFGLRHIVCSPDSVDAFNPKVVQSTMGALYRVKVHYLDLVDLIREPSFTKRIVYGTFLEGEDLYETRLEAYPLILFGNESRGLSDRIGKHCTKITIPSFASSEAGVGGGSESLNLASSVAIICSEFRRSHSYTRP